MTLVRNDLRKIASIISFNCNLLVVNGKNVFYRCIFMSTNFHRQISNDAWVLFIIHSHQIISNAAKRNKVGFQLNWLIHLKLLNWWKHQIILMSCKCLFVVSIDWLHAILRFEITFRLYGHSAQNVFELNSNIFIWNNFNYFNWR